jgi:hypothetical protein
MCEILQSTIDSLINTDINRTELLNIFIDNFFRWVGILMSFIAGIIVTKTNLYNKLAGKIVKVEVEEGTYKYSNSERIYVSLNLNIVNNTDSKIYINNLTLLMDKKECKINTSWDAQEYYRFEKIVIEPDEPETIQIPFNEDLVRNLDSLSFNKEVSRIKVILKNNNKSVFSRKLNKKYVEAWNNLLEISKV